MRGEGAAAQEWLASVEDPIDMDERILATIRRERALLVDQIRKSEQTIEQSKELIKKLDELLARSGLKEP
jgi:hypoxanthine phosphoribosyltransferase